MTCGNVHIPRSHRCTNWRYTGAWRVVDRQSRPHPAAVKSHPFGDEVARRLQFGERGADGAAAFSWRIAGLAARAPHVIGGGVPAVGAAEEFGEDAARHPAQPVVADGPVGELHEVACEAGAADPHRAPESARVRVRAHAGIVTTGLLLGTQVEIKGPIGVDAPAGPDWVIRAL